MPSQGVHINTGPSPKIQYVRLRKAYIPKQESTPELSTSQVNTIRSNA